MVLTLVPEANSNSGVKRQLTTDEAVALVVRAEGNLSLAAERAKITKQDLLIALTRTSDGFRILSDQLRTLQLLKSYNLLNTMETNLLDQLDAMKPDDAVRAYKSVADLFAGLTSAGSKMSEPTQNNTVNQINVLLSNMPQPVRDAFLTLVSPSSAISSARGEQDSDGNSHAKPSALNGARPPGPPVCEEASEIPMNPIDSAYVLEGLGRRGQVIDDD